MSLFGQTALIEAVKSNNAKIVEMLINYGANVNTEERGYRIFYKDYYRNTELLQAVNNENIAIMELLISANVDINAKNSKGETSLILAIKKWQ